MRLGRNRAAATALTILLSVLVFFLKSATVAALPFPIFAGILVGRVAMTWLQIFFYLRGGVLLVWWMALLMELRHLLAL